MRGSAPVHRSSASRKLHVKRPCSVVHCRLSARPTLLLPAHCLHAFYLHCKRRQGVVAILGSYSVASLSAVAGSGCRVAALGAGLPRRSTGPVPRYAAEHALDAILDDLQARCLYRLLPEQALAGCLACFLACRAGRQTCRQLSRCTRWHAHAGMDNCRSAHATLHRFTLEGRVLQCLQEFQGLDSEQAGHGGSAGRGLHATCRSGRLC